LADLGRREEALAAIQEAVTIRRELAARWPDAHRHELEESLRVAAWLEHGEDLSGASPQEPYEVITARYHFLRQQRSCRSPDAIIWTHRCGLGSGASWRTGATERPFGCGSHGISADWDLPPIRRISHTRFHVGSDAS
jgi:hypothetical protein